MNGQLIAGCQSFTGETGAEPNTPRGSCESTVTSLRGRCCQHRKHKDVSLVSFLSVMSGVGHCPFLESHEVKTVATSLEQFMDEAWAGTVPCPAPGCHSYAAQTAISSSPKTSLNACSGVDEHIFGGLFYV